jgi:hypothetical protein
MSKTRWRKPSHRTTNCRTLKCRPSFGLFFLAMIIPIGTVYWRSVSQY